jgi:hypothetical protein
MEGGSQGLSPMERAARYVAAYGRSYSSHKGTRVVIQLFTKQAKRLEELRQVFGGNYYRHKAGFMWVTGKKDVLLHVAEAVRPYLADRHRLGVLLDYAEAYNVNPTGSGDSSSLHEGESADDQSVLA